MRVKKGSITYWKDKAWKMFSKFIRYRDCLKTTETLTQGKCYTCGKLLNFEELEAGHFMSRKWLRTFVDETNVHAQCSHCNKWEHGNLLEYRRNLVRDYGNGFDEILEKRAKEEVKYNADYWGELFEYYKDKVMFFENNYKEKEK